MAGPKRPPSRRRASFSPKPKKPEPRASGRPPAQPAAPPPRAHKAVPPRRVEQEAEPDLVEEAKKGAAGRSLAAPKAPVVTQKAEPEQSLPPGASPFAQYSDGVEMAGHLERGRADTVRVVAIMAGLLFVVGSAMVLSGAAIVAGLAWTGQLDEMAAGDQTDGDPTHIRDTGLIKRGTIEAPQRRRSSGGSGGAAPEAAPEPEAPKPAPVTVKIPPGIMFHEVEVSCPSGWRGRSRVSGNQATVKNVPPSMECRLTFKGGQPAQTKVFAGQTISCTFDPTKCMVER